VGEALARAGAMRPMHNLWLLSPGNHARFWPFLAKLTRVHSQDGARGITGLGSEDSMTSANFKRLALGVIGGLALWSFLLLLLIDAAQLLHGR
jgi:hypothetical protein